MRLEGIIGVTRVMLLVWELLKGKFQDEKMRTRPRGSGTSSAVVGSAINGTFTCTANHVRKRRSLWSRGAGRRCTFLGAIQLSRFFKAKLIDFIRTPICNRWEMMMMMMKEEEENSRER